MRTVEQCSRHNNKDQTHYSSMIRTQAASILLALKTVMNLKALLVAFIFESGVPDQPVSSLRHRYCYQREVLSVEL